MDHETTDEYTLYTELRCELRSPAMPELLNGHWHHVAFTVDAANFLVVFYVDGAYVTKKLVKQSCTKVKASRSDGESVDKAGPLDGKLGARQPATSFLGINLAKQAKSNDARVGPSK